jgi:competence protein ComEC
MPFSKLFYLVLGIILLIRTAFYFLNPAQTRSLAVGEVELQGVVETVPKVTAKSRQFNFQGYLVVMNLYPPIEYGDRIIVKGVSNKNTKVLFPLVKMVEKAKGNTILQAVYDFKNYLVKNIQKMLPEPQAGLMAGILLGEKSALEPSLKENLRNTGLTHVVAASGANLTFLSTIIIALAILIAGRRQGSLLAIPVIWLYAVMAGFDPAVVRAAIMVSFTFLAQFFGRDSGKWRGLVLACYLMILFDPAIIFNLGFQLSVAAMSGIIIADDFPIRFFEPIKQTLFAQIMTLPLIISIFGRYSLLSLGANLLTLWMIPWIMSFGLAAGLTGWTLLAIPAYILLSWFVLVAAYFGKLNLLVLEVREVNPATTIGIYLLLISCYLCLKIYGPSMARKLKPAP